MKHKPEALIDAAIALFDEQGVGISTAKVAAAAGVSNGTLFNYFPTKQALIDAVYVTVKTELGNALGEFEPGVPVREQIETIWQRWITWALESPSYHRVARLLSESGLASADAVEAAMASFATSQPVLQEARAQGLLTDLPDDYLAALVQQQLELAISAQLTPDQQKLAFDAMWNSIARTPTLEHPQRQEQ